MRYVVTGGCGFLGAAVVRALVERGDNVLNIDGRRKSNPAPALAPIAGRENHVRLEANVKDGVLLRSLFREFKPDRVIHLASTPETDAKAQFTLEIDNAFGVLDACKDYVDRLPEPEKAGFRLVQAVRIARPPDVLERPFHPREAAQQTADALMLNWSKSQNLALVTCMADEVIGPGQPETSLIPGLIDAALAGRPYVFAADSHVLKDYLPLADMAAGVILAADKGRPFGCYEFSVKCERRDVDIAESVCAVLDRQLPRPRGASWSEFLALPAADTAREFSPMLDATRAERELGWAPGGFYDGLVRTITWALSRHVPQPARAPAPARQDEPPFSLAAE